MPYSRQKKIGAEFEAMVAKCDCESTNSSTWARTAKVSLQLKEFNVIKSDSSRNILDSD